VRLRSSILGVALLCSSTVAVEAGESMALQSLVTFSTSDDGPQPTSLIRGSDGNLYGTSSGIQHLTSLTNGTVFKLTPGGDMTVLALFSPNDTNGYHPVALVQATDGNFYGANYYGGPAPYYGTIFKVAPGGALSTVFSFNGTNGRQPSAVVQGVDGNLYGATRDGGSDGYGSYGTVFKLTTNGVLTTLKTFFVPDGVRPNHLIQGSDGNLYGTTFDDVGVNAVDSVFRLTLSGQFTTLASGRSNTPAGPTALVQGNDGALYVASGGRGAFGSIFRVTTNGSVTILVEFNGTNGWQPSSLLIGTDGALYGTTQYGGADYTDPVYPDYDPTGSGTIFRLTLSGTVTTLTSFQGTNGSNPWLLAQTAEGNLYAGTESTTPPYPAAIFRLAPRPIITALERSTGYEILRWASFAGGKYQLENNSSLSTSAWTEASTIATASGATTSATNSASPSPEHYYRVRLLP
jgi:uncharacterized repeat protein (TIGR03803 family)